VRHLVHLVTVFRTSQFFIFCGRGEQKWTF